eukprot:GHVL01006061.1.p1 GENE.GHVL01006061.1~~GHVL01006061.1.p1  ORF type:complete len:245 (+),score=40.66 GHVL01006061.1:295-1029(+)
MARGAGPVRALIEGKIMPSIETLIPSNAKETKRKMHMFMAGTLAGAVLVSGLCSIDDVNSVFWSFGTKLCHKFLDPEQSHDMAIWLGEHGLFPKDYSRDDHYNIIKIGHLTFTNPIGLAAGFDKNARCALELANMGFGFVEVGTVTPEPQGGNEKPRLFRLDEDKAVINRFGFNSDGGDIVVERVKNIISSRTRDRLASRMILGVNIGKNKMSEDAVKDFETGAIKFGPYIIWLLMFPLRILLV